LGEAEQRCARRAAEEALRTLARRLVEAEVASQRQLARELHDRIGQNLAALNINLNILRGRLVELTRDDAILSRLDDSLTLNAETIARVRDLLAELRPPVLEDYGLIAALRAFAERFTTRTGIEVTVEGRELVPRPSPAVEAALYRIAQEALTNTAKHARARSARVSVDYLPVLRLTISDDGIGFAAHAMEAGTGAHWGLRNMRERALAVGGELAIESAPGAGTRVTVTLKEAAS
ncbi:MAG TPA: sensor histidine kinase, partial [Gammaproteobacteria bacterium]|nr:sensor histidine kinase [Gammaproteobacteria bacterium]